jgi:hypothetical protein
MGLSTTIAEGSKGNLPNIILGGDFNLPHIDWSLNTVKPNPQYGKEINKKLRWVSLILQFFLIHCLVVCKRLLYVEVGCLQC